MLSTRMYLFIFKFSSWGRRYILSLESLFIPEYKKVLKNMKRRVKNYKPLKKRMNDTISIVNIYVHIYTYIDTQG